MKKLIYFSLLIVLFLFITTSKTQAETYLGESCWQVFDDVGNPEWIYKFGVYEKEGGHYTLFGSDDFTDAAHGNAEIVGSEVKMTIVGAGVGSIGDGAPGYVWNETFIAVLNISTLNGTWHSLEIEYDSVSGTQLSYNNGTITHITCP